MRPIVHRDEYTEWVARPIADYFRDVIFGPLFEYLRENGVEPHSADQAIQHGDDNSETVRAALIAGVIWYADGVFSGKFNARLSRALRGIGATFGNGVFRLSDAKLPLDVKAAAVQSAMRAEALHKGVIDLIDQMQANTPKAPLGIETGEPVKKVVASLNDQFDASGPEAANAPAAPVDPTAARANEILQVQIQVPIRNFTAEQLADLRSRVQRNAVENGRADRLAKLIETRYGIAKRRATFIGEQETSLLISNYRERRYKSIGLHQYRWSDSHDAKVRHDHHELNGTVQDWSNPPVTNRKTGARNHPGQDFNCRCNAIPMTVLASRN